MLDRHSLRRLPAVSLTQFPPVLAAGGRSARLEAGGWRLEADLGTIYKLPCCLIHTRAMLLHTDLMMLVNIMIKPNWFHGARLFWCYVFILQKYFHKNVFFPPIASMSGDPVTPNAPSILLLINKHIHVVHLKTVKTCCSVCYNRIAVLVWPVEIKQLW